MFHVSTIKNWFKGKADDWNKVVEFLNNLCGDGFIRVSRPDKPSNGSPPMISLDMEKVQVMIHPGKVEIDDPQEISSGAGRAEQYVIPNGADDTEWHRGEEPKGVKLKVYTMLSLYQGCIYGIFRELTFDKDGHLCEVGPEKFGDYMMAGY